MNQRIGTWTVARTARLALVAVATLALGACGGISQRAVANGRAMGLQQPLQYQGFRDMSSMKRGYYQSNPLSAMRRQPPYTPFARWH
jgi:hypothetical protein